MDKRQTGVFGENELGTGSAVACVSSKEFTSAAAWFKNFKDEIFNKNKRVKKLDLF